MKEPINVAFKCLLRLTQLHWNGNLNCLYIYICLLCFPGLVRPHCMFHSIIIHKSVCADTILRGSDDCKLGRFSLLFLNRYWLMSNKKLPLDIQFLGELALFSGPIQNWPIDFISREIWTYSIKDWFLLNTWIFII